MPSQTPLPVSACSVMPPAASRMPIRAAVSSNATVFAVGSGVREHVLQQRRPAARRPRGAAARTRLEPRGALEEERHAQHDVRHGQRLDRLGVQQRVDALVDREAGAEHEDPDGREQRPEVALHAVAERVLPVGGLLAALERGQQEDLVDRVRDRVRALGEHRRRAGQRAGHDLGDRDRQVRAARHQHGAERPVLLLLSHGRSVPHGPSRGRGGCGRATECRGEAVPAARHPGRGRGRRQRVRRLPGVRRARGVRSCTGCGWSGDRSAPSTSTTGRGSSSAAARSTPATPTPPSRRCSSAWSASSRRCSTSSSRATSRSSAPATASA